MNRSALKPIHWLVLALAVLLAAAPLFGRAVHAKYVILIIGDGMHYEHERAASLYWTGEETGLSFHSLPYQGFMTTWDVNTYDAYARRWGDWKAGGGYRAKDFQPEKGYSVEVAGASPRGKRKTGGMVDRYFQNKILYGKKPAATDSASAATAMYTGIKTDAGNISWLPGDPADGALLSIGELMKNQLGASYGAVSTVEITHATPAAVYAHNINRSNYSPEKKRGDVTTIAEELTTSGIDVAIGAGHPDYASRYFTDTLLNTMKSNSSYVVVERTDGVDGNTSLLAAADTAESQGKKLFGLFGGAGGDFENRVVTDTPGSPSIDRGEAENPTFATMITSALKVLSTNSKGLFLVAEQGNLDWRNHGLDYKGMVGCIVDLHEGVQAAVDYVNQSGDDMTWDNTLLIVTSDHSTSYMRIVKPLGMGELPPQKSLGDGPYGPIYGTDSYSGYVTYGYGEHTNELVSVYARGAGVSYLEGYEGAWYPGTNLLDNTHIFWAMAKAVGVSPSYDELSPK